jgi:hypothetical protein
MADIIIDLEDGLPPAEVVRIEKPKGPNAPRFAAPEVVEITSTPVAVTISYAMIHCLSCGATHKDHRGVFLESRLSNGVRVLQRKSLRELVPFSSLPRRVDEAPPEAVPLCSDCFLGSAFTDAVAVAAVQGDLFGEPAAPTPIATIAEAIVEDSIEIEEEEL